MNFAESIRDNRPEMVNNLRELIQIPSVDGEPKPNMPYGEEADRALQYCLDLGNSLGFKTDHMDRHVGWCEFGEGEEMVCVLAHLDVVPEGTGWTHPPFGAEVVDGKIYGRGAIDNKGSVISAIYAMNAIKESGLKINRRIRIMFGLNEEKGSGCIRHYVANGGEIPVMAFTPDADFPIINGEKGHIIGTFGKKIEKSDRYLKFIHGGTVPNIVPEYAKAIVVMPENEMSAILDKKFEKVEICKVENTLVIEAHGESAHASIPHTGDNAFFRLFTALGEMGLDGTSGELVSFINEKFAPDVNGKALGVHCCDELSGDLTLNLGIMGLDNEDYFLNMDIRFPVTADGVEIQSKLENIMTASGFSIKDIHNTESLYMPADSRLIKTLSLVYEATTGEKAELMCIGGGTYAKAIPNCVAFGPAFPDNEAVMHKPDEYIEIEHLIKITNIYANAMYELSIIS